MSDSSFYPEQGLSWWLALQRLPHVGPVTANKLLARFHTPDAVFAPENYGVLQRNLAPDTLRCIEDYSVNREASTLGRLVYRDLAWLENSNVKVITQHCRAYPELLKQIYDPPPFLFVLGNPELLSRPQLAIVGSRNPTINGRGHAFSFAGDLSRRGFVITSGLALGVDALAHQGTLAATGETIAVLGTSIDKVYPRSHKHLLQDIAETGAVVSEFPLNTGPRKQHFPRRNRLISGLSAGVLVIEAALKSGSLITAKYALEHNREVFAIPGSINNPMAKGCHALIRQGAKLVECAEHVEEELTWLIADVVSTSDASNVHDNSNTNTNISSNGNNNTVVKGADRERSKTGELLVEQFTIDENRLIRCIGGESATIDQLVDQTGMAAAVVSSSLMMLELKGVVASEFGRYQVIDRAKLAEFSLVN